MFVAQKLEVFFSLNMFSISFLAVYKISSSCSCGPKPMDDLTE